MRQDASSLKSLTSGRIKTNSPDCVSGHTALRSENSKIAACWSVVQQTVATAGAGILSAVGALLGTSWAAENISFINAHPVGAFGSLCCLIGVGMVSSLGMRIYHMFNRDKQLRHERDRIAETLASSDAAQQSARSRNKKGLTDIAQNIARAIFPEKYVFQN